MGPVSDRDCRPGMAVQGHAAQGADSPGRLRQPDGLSWMGAAPGIQLGCCGRVHAGRGALRCNTSWCNHKALRRARSVTVDKGNCW